MKHEAHATYIGPIESLKGKRALIRPGCEGRVTLAQFDDHTPRPDEMLDQDNGFPDLMFGWTEFDPKHFDKRWCHRPLLAICRGTKFKGLNGEMGTVTFRGNTVSFRFSGDNAFMDFSDGTKIPVPAGDTVSFNFNEITPELLED